MPFLDVALVYDPDARACDLALGDDGDLLLDETSITPVLLSVGLDRRAAPDDPLPDGRNSWLASTSLSPRRGAAADALDPRGERIGSRLWLLDRAKKTETTRLLFQHWLDECLTWTVSDGLGPAAIDVAWLPSDHAPTGRLGYRVLVDDAAVSLATRSA